VVLDRVLPGVPSNIPIDQAVSPAIYRDCLGPELAEGRFCPAPPAQVVGRGLAAIQTVFDIAARSDGIIYLAFNHDQPGPG
jgi:hypothetical protein